MADPKVLTSGFGICAPDPQSHRIRQQLDWRHNSDPATTNAKSRTPRKKSHGISPIKFHQHHTTRSPVNALNCSDNHKRDRCGPLPHQNKDGISMTKFRSRIYDQLLHNEKREHLAKLATKRAVFRNLTQVKRWPLQDMAMQHLQDLIESSNPDQEAACEANGNGSIEATSSNTNFHSSAHGKAKNIDNGIVKDAGTRCSGSSSSALAVAVAALKETPPSNPSVV